MKNRKFWVYDIEILSNYCLLVFLNVDTGERRRFDFGSWMLNEKLKGMKGYLFRFVSDKVDYLCGFNNLNFDDRILFAILTDRDGHDPGFIYNKSQEIIKDEYSQKISVLVRDLRIRKSLDLFRVWHFDNKARATSLKWIQCHLNMDLIEEMPYDHTEVIDVKKAEDVFRYCVNDVVTTLAFLTNEKTQQLIEMRRGIGKKYPFDPTNMSNSSIGEKIFLSELPVITEKHKPSVFLPLHEVLLEKACTMKTPEMQSAVWSLGKETVAVYKPEKVKYVVNYKGLKYEFGLGGLHAVGKPNLFEGKILSIDVESYYPNISIVNGLHPQHLGRDFVDTYQRLFKTRQSHPKGSVMNMALKEALNSVFGKSNSEHSDLFDPSFTYSITLNGQLMLARLCEMIGENKKAGKVIMANTDGIEVLVDGSSEEATRQMVEEWCNEFGFKVSINHYKQLMIRDVNNYIGVYEDNTVKCKGAYELTKDFNKDPSGPIIARATVKALLEKKDKLYSTSIMETAMKESRIKAFSMFLRAKTGKIYARTADGSYTWELPKTIRYIVAKKGYVLYKKTDKKEERIHPGCFVIILNDMEKALEEHTVGKLRSMIHTKWYTHEAMKLWVEPEPELF